MSLKYSELRQLASAALNAPKGAPVAYSVSDTENYSLAQVNETLRNELNSLCGDYRSMRENQNTVFRLIEESIDEVLPARVLAAYEQFAEVRSVPQGDRVIFRQRISNAARERAKTFVTRVGLAGRYETFILDGQELEVKTGAIGAAAKIAFEEVLDGRWQFSDMIDIVMEGFDDWLYKEIAAQLEQAVALLPEVNKAEVAGFDETTMDDLLGITDSYGRTTIYCTQEFAAKMVPAEGWRSSAMKDQRWNNGYLATYKGHNVVILPQSLVDNTNQLKVIDPAQAYLIPSGQDERPVKIVLEGDMLVRNCNDNDDWSQEIQWYKKVGVGILWTNHWICSYRNTDLTKETRSA
jgi:hypothetical protein